MGRDSKPQGLLARLLRRGSRRDLDPRAELGRTGERAAAHHLRKHGYRIIGRNLRLSAAEVDLLAVAPDRRTIAVVEVKSRRCSQHDDGTFRVEMNLKPAQRKRLRAAAVELRTRNNWRDRPIRLDLVTVEWPADGGQTPEVRHFEGAI